MENQESSNISKLIQRADLFHKMLSNFENSEKCFNSTNGALIKSYKEIKNQIRNQESNKNLKLIELEKSAKIFVIFSKTQDICHKFLKNAYDNEKFDVLYLKEIKLEEPELKDDSTLENYEIDSFFKDLKERIPGEKDLNQIIKNLYDKLVDNTVKFFSYIDKFIFSLNQYLEIVNERTCANPSLIELKKLFNGFNNLREPAIHLIHLYNGQMIKTNVITNKDEAIKEEKSIIEKIQNKQSYVFQEEGVSAIIKYVNSLRLPEERQSREEVEDLDEGEIGEEYEEEYGEEYEEEEEFQDDNDND